MTAWVWVLIAVIVLVVAGLVAVSASRRARERRTAALRERFGPEYDRAVQARADQGAAEAELRSREQQRAALDIRPLPEGMKAGFAGEWRAVQEQFVDEPAEAVVAGDRLVSRVMEARGYPAGGFGERADLVSVDHPELVEDYRYAYRIRQRAETGRVGTEELRQALLRCRSLFNALLEPGDGTASQAQEPPAAERTAREPAPAESVAAEPAPAEPVAAEPAPAEPVAAEPVPAEPAPAEPAPAEPASAGPMAAESAPAGSAEPGYQGQAADRRA
ncbi:MAG: hypothetical protein ACM32E_19620 [Gemmatimonadota bacterium]